MYVDAQRRPVIEEKCGVVGEEVPCEQSVQRELDGKTYQPDSCIGLAVHPPFQRQRSRKRIHHLHFYRRLVPPACPEERWASLPALGSPPNHPNPTRQG